MAKIFLIEDYENLRDAVSSYLKFDETAFLGTFDFSKALLPGFLEKVEPKESRADIESALKANPFMWMSLPPHFAFVGLSCTAGASVTFN